MRILIVNSGLRHGGAETQIIGLAKELVRRGNDVALYTLTADVPRKPDLDGSGVKVVVDEKKSKLDLGVLARLRRFIRTWRADIVHGYLYDGNVYSRVAAAGLGVPVLNAERNDNYALRRSQKLPHYLTRHLADGVVANTHAGRDFARQLFGFPDARLHVVWNGVRMADVAQRIAACRADYRNEFFANRDVKLACLVGTIMPSKDTLLALDVADRLTAANPSWRVVFVGDTFQQALAYDCKETSGGQDYKAQVMADFARRKLEGRAVFAGQRADALEIIAQADVLYSTSMHEGFPNVVLEAMAAGTPAVAVDYSDIRRILPFDWQVLADRDPDRIAAAILRADAEREDVSSRQREWVAEHATIEGAAQRLETIYRDCLAG